MPELRHDPIQKRWVIIASERAARPDDFQFEPEEKKTGFCPFCEGAEDKTPPEIFAFRNEGTPRNGKGWKVRVVSNKFPALRIEGNLDRKGMGLYDRMNGIGAHEVIIETPQHDQTLADMPVEQLELVLKACRQRLCDLMQDHRFKYVLIFKNHGKLAGASLAHPHTQIIATPVTPRTVAVELDSAKSHYHDKERCLFCDIITDELDKGTRIIRADEHFVTLAPFASRFPFELFIAPAVHQANFATINDEDIHHLSVTLKDILSRIKVGLKDPPFNFLLHTTPNVHATARRSAYWGTLEHDFHWHLEIMPRLTRIAGFEWGTGFYINPVAPEEVAKYLRELSR
jgi:UDPglucose--hexose-1-phosphate uridylyltransferase